MRLIIAANRAPYFIKKRKDSIVVERSAGGLVTAIDPIMKQTEGIWVCTSKDDQFHSVDLPYEIRNIKLSSEENYHYYEGFGNRQIWPLFHYFPTRYNHNEKDWKFYEQVNQKFANQIFSFVRDDDVIWIHDYHLMLVPQMLREVGVKNKIGFFLHIPFPNNEVFRISSKRKEILEGILGCDLVGFHTKSYKKHFLESVKKQITGAKVDIHNNDLNFRGRDVVAKTFPISIDFHSIEDIAKSDEVAEKTKELKDHFQVENIAIGVDRLDYSKGILERLEGIEYFLDTYPDYHKKIVFIQLAVPSRTKVMEYKKIKQQVDEAVGRINGKFSKDGWSPITYIYNSVPLKDLIAYYSCANIALITPLRDGMNLVAKEYIASRINNDGMLVLSEFTGVAEEVDCGNVINPYDARSIGNGILRAIEVPESIKTEIMTKLRCHIRENDVYKWVNDFLCQL